MSRLCCAESERESEGTLEKIESRKKRSLEKNKRTTFYEQCERFSQQFRPPCENRGTQRRHITFIRLKLIVKIKDVDFWWLIMS